MTKAQALKKWKAMYKGMDSVPAIQDGGKRLASTPERRAEARAKLQELNRICTTHELRKQYRKERDHWLGESYRYRYCIGHLGMGGLFFGVDGSGDSWEECFTDYENKWKKAA